MDGELTLTLPHAPTKRALAQKQAAFLRHFVESGTLRQAERVSGISRSSHRRWLKSDPEYREEFEEAREEAIERLEAEAIHRAVEGDWVMKFHLGQPIMVPLVDAEGRPVMGADGEPMMVPYRERRKSDVLLIFLLKGMRPDKYRDNISMQVKREYTEEDLERWKQQHGWREGDTFESCMKRLEEATDIRRGLSGS